jgi:hypothetical protein
MNLLKVVDFSSKIRSATRNKQMGFHTPRLPQQTALWSACLYGNLQGISF